jgi:methionyl-tRNA synthetase
MGVADVANRYIDDHKPWQLAKDPQRRDELATVLSVGVHAFRIIAIALAPILPATASAIGQWLGEDAGAWTVHDCAISITGRQLEVFRPLLTRIDPKHIEAMIEASKDTLAAAGDLPAKPPAGGPDASKRAQYPSSGASISPSATDAAPGGTATDIVEIDDFARLDLRIGKVIACEAVEGSDKLLRFELEAGDLGIRQIFSGIKSAYPDPAALVGRHVVFIANLAPRRMRFGVSEGMILSAGGADGQLFLLDVDTGARSGMPVK